MFAGQFTKGKPPTSEDEVKCLTHLCFSEVYKQLTHTQGERKTRARHMNHINGNLKHILYIKIYEFIVNY